MRVYVLAITLFMSSVVAAQSGQGPQSAPPSDPIAISIVQKVVSLLTGGGQVADVTIKASAISVLGSDAETGTATLLAKGTGESRIDLVMSQWTRTDVRNVSNGLPVGEWIKNGGTPVTYAMHNSWIDASWFFPTLSSLAQLANPNFTIKYIGQEQHSGVSVQHVRMFQVAPADTINQFNAAHLSAMDFYFDSQSFLPVAIAFQTHPDNDMNVDIPVEVSFGNYQITSGILVPFHIQKMLNGTVMLDLTVTSVLVNSGVPDTAFGL